MTQSLPSAGGPRRRAVPDLVLEIPSDPKAIEGIVNYLVDRLEAHAFSGSRLNLNFRVGLTEALANAVLYGNCSDAGKCVRLEVSLGRDRVDMTVVDQGGGFDPVAIPDPTLPENIERPGGRGIFLLRKLMDEVEFNERGNAVRLVLFREAPGA